MNASLKDRFDIAIIGGGVSGALTVIQLVHNVKESPIPAGQLTIAFIDESKRPGRGVAYSTTCPQHLLNVPAKGMSAYPDQPNHFFDWFKNKIPSARLETFAPRMIYGDYIEELLRAALAKNDAHVAVSYFEAGAVAITNSDEQTYTVDLASGTKVGANTIVLATGNFPPEKSLAASFNVPDSRFHDDPWAAKDMEAKIGTHEDVLIMGTGLTMIDVVILLKESGHRGRYYALSRHGYLPQEHYSYAELAKEKPTNFLDLPEKGTLLECFHAMKQASRKANAQAPGQWRGVMQELRARTSACWSQFDLANKKRFLRHVRQLWEVHRHRMAPEIAAYVHTWQSDGSLKVIAGRIISVTTEGDKLRVTYRHRGGKEDSVLVGHIVNCTGPETDFRRVTHPLIKNMRDSGTTVADELGLGAVVDEDGATIDAKGNLSRIYAVGSIRKGSLWESTAVPELRAQAAEMAKLLLAKTKLARAGAKELV